MRIVAAKKNEELIKALLELSEEMLKKMAQQENSNENMTDKEE